MTWISALQVQAEEMQSSIPGLEKKTLPREEQRFFIWLSGLLQVLIKSKQQSRFFF